MLRKSSALLLALFLALYALEASGQDSLPSHPKNARGDSNMFQLTNGEVDVLFVAAMKDSRIPETTRTLYREICSILFGEGFRIINGRMKAPIALIILNPWDDSKKKYPENEIQIGLLEPGGDVWNVFLINISRTDHMERIITSIALWDMVNYLKDIQKLSPRGNGVRYQLAPYLCDRS